jgi:hypothetical protein
MATVAAQLPQTPGRVRLRYGRKIPGVVDVRLGPWTTPFRIRPINWADRNGPCQIVWVAKGAGVLRRRPDAFHPIARRNRHEAQETILVLFRAWLLHPDRALLLARIRTELRGKKLGCACGASIPCHADVLLELANGDGVAQPIGGRPKSRVISRHMGANGLDSGEWDDPQA